MDADRRPEGAGWTYLKPETAEMRPQRTGLKLERTDWMAERVAFRPKIDDLKP